MVGQRPNFIAFLLVGLALTCLSDAKIFEPSDASGNLSIVGSINYIGSSSSPPCDFLHEPCAPLNDCWGTERDGKQFAFVGMSNGVDFLDTTNPARPKKTAPDAFIAGCITEWRDIKSYKNTVYVVNDETSFCICEQQPCQFQLQLTGLPSVTTMDAILGGVGASLADGAAIEGLVTLPSNADKLDGCAVDTWAQAPADVDWIGLVERGNCSFAVKLEQAQLAGAKGLIVINYRNDDIPPSMMGANGQKYGIPIALVSKSNGDLIVGRLQDSASVFATFAANSYVYNPELQAPEGLWVVNFTTPEAPTLVSKRRDWFNSAHNILVDTFPSRPYLYACGMDTNNGGLMMFDITNPFDPVLVGSWNTSYFHDVEIAYRADLKKYVMFGSAIYDNRMYMLDVDNPTHSGFLSVLAVWETPAWPHNTASTPDGKVLFVTHEDFSMAITIWNVEDLTKILYVANISIEADRNTIPHNIYLRGEHLWASYYVNGVAVFSIKNPHEPELLAISSAMVDPQFPPGSGYHGVWGVYPLPSADTVSAYASDIETGFYTLKMTLPPTKNTDEGGISGFAIFVVIVVIVLVAGGCFFVYRYMKTHNIDLRSIPSQLMPSASPSDAQDHERLALDDELDDDDEYYRNEI